MGYEKVGNVREQKGAEHPTCFLCYCIGSSAGFLHKGNCSCLEHALWDVTPVCLTCCPCSFPCWCAVDLAFPENSTRPVLRDGPNAIALYRGNSSSFAPGKALTTAGLLDAFVYMSTEGLSPELLDTLTPGRPAYGSVR